METINEGAAPSPELAPHNSTNDESKGNKIESEMPPQVRGSEREIPGSETAGREGSPAPGDNPVEMSSKSSDTKPMGTPFIPDEIFPLLPKSLREECDCFKDNKRERDVYLLSALTILSGCIDSVFGIYDHRKYFTNIYAWVIAPAASGKSSMLFAKELGMVIHRQYLKENAGKIEKYKSELDNYEASKRSKYPIHRPTIPQLKQLFIPGNSSAAAIVSTLKQSGVPGIICETEADTVSNCLKQDWGNWSDMLRKFSQHETVTSGRKGKGEFIEYTELDSPQVSTLITSSRSQVSGIISSAENGLFSRFLFYAFKSSNKWKDVSPGKDNRLEFFSKQSEEVEKMSVHLHAYPTEVLLSVEQWDLLNGSGNRRLQEVSKLVGDDATSIVKRLGLIQFRICMILTAIRKYESKSTLKLVTCDDSDFQISDRLTEVYLQHALALFEFLPKSQQKRPEKNMKRLFDILPTGCDFTRGEAVAIGKELPIEERTVDNYLADLLKYGLLKQSYKTGPYIKSQ